LRKIIPKYFKKQGRYRIADGELPRYQLGTQPISADRKYPPPPPRLFYDLLSEMPKRYGTGRGERFFGSE